MSTDRIEIAELTTDETETPESEDLIAEAPLTTEIDSYEEATAEFVVSDPETLEQDAPTLEVHNDSDGFALESNAETPSESVPSPDEAFASNRAEDQLEGEPVSEQADMPAAVDTIHAEELPASEPDAAEDNHFEQATASVDVAETVAPEASVEGADETAPQPVIENGQPAETQTAAGTPGGKQGSSRRPKLPDIDYTDVEDNRLIREVFAAPHKVYLLNKVRKAIAAAGDSDLGIQLRMVEADILHQVSERREAKEALCERAEAIKDSTSWKVTGDAYKTLFDEWKQVGAAGRELDDELWVRFNAARGTFNERRAKHFEERELVWSANRAKKEELCAQAEAIAESTEWKATADKIRDLQTQWKSAGSAGRERDDALWARFNTAKQQFFDRRTEVWAENRKRKEALVLDAETLKDSTDWRTAGEAMKVMQAEWKTIGPAGREAEDELWGRFRAATQAFFDRRSSTFAERNQSERENLAKKQELIARAEALVYSGDSLAAAREAKEFQAQWKETGPVPREQSEAIWARFRGACDRIFENAHGERDRQQNEWHVRMREALIRKREQLNALRESISHDEANIERWRSSLSTLQPGGKSEEIGKSLEDKIIDVMERIRDKQTRAEDLRSSITDIEAKLRE